MKKLKLTIALLMVISFIAILFTTNVYATDTTATPGTTETEKVYTYEMRGAAYYHSESTHWNIYVPEEGTGLGAFLKVKENGVEISNNQLTDEMKVTSSDETILKVADNNEVIPLKTGTVDLLQGGKKVGAITVYANRDEWNTKYEEFRGTPVIVINDNNDNYIKRTDTRVVSSVDVPKLEIKLLKDGKIVDLTPLWEPAAETTDIVSVENGIITPKKAGDAIIKIPYDDNGGSTDVSKKFHITFYDTETIKCDLQVIGYEGRAITVATENGKEVIIEKGHTGVLKYIFEGEEIWRAHKDVYVKYADESIVAQNLNLEYEIEAKKVGTTSITVERTGKSAETMKVRVVESIYQYKEENPELFPEDFEVINRESVEPEKDYEKLNTELLDTADTLYVNMSDENSVIKSDVFKSLKEYKDRNLTFTLYNETGTNYTTWTFDSNNIKNTDIDVMPKLEISTERFDNIKTDEVEDGIFIKFLHNGYLPGKAEVTIDSYDAWKKYGDTQKTLNLYYYNPKTNDYEKAGTVEYDRGILSFSIEHCSDYVATELGLKGKKDKVIAKLDDEPKAGDESIVVFSAFVAIATLGGIVLVTKKK